MPEGLHVRVYHEDLMKNFAQVWDDNDALATWLRLFVIADKLWPSPGELPRVVGRAALKRLTDAGLIVLLPNYRYTCLGLDADRQRRSDAARTAANVRHHGRPDDDPPEGNAGRTPSRIAPRNPSGNAGALPHTDTGARPRSGSAPESVSDVLNEIGAAGEEPDALVGYHTLTGRFPTGRVKSWLDELAHEHGDVAVTRALALEMQADTAVHTLLSRTQNRLAVESHADEKDRKLRRQQSAAEERALIESMPAEQRAANLARLRAELAKHGLVPLEGGTDAA